MKRVIIESPFAGADRDKKQAYLRAAMIDSIGRGEAPFASHMLYTQLLDDDVPSERMMGMRCGFAWIEVADMTAVYEDLGISEGMKRGIQVAEIQGRKVEYRRLGGWGAAASGVDKAVDTAA